MFSPIVWLTWLRIFSKSLSPTAAFAAAHSPAIVGNSVSPPAFLTQSEVPSPANTIRWSH